MIDLDPLKEVNCHKLQKEVDTSMDRAFAHTQVHEVFYLL